MSASVVWKIDPFLLRATRGRLGMGLILPTALLGTRGARTGAPRHNGVIYFHDADAVIIVASKAGADHHPSWFHNLVAHPAVTLNDEPLLAEEVVGEAERERLWGLADRVFHPYATYRAQAAAAGRTIPIVRLTRSRHAAHASP